jgi:CRP-like cAMP-binding protein
MEKTSQLRAILRHTTRSDQDVAVLQENTKEIGFFSRLSENHGSSDLHLQCCRVMQFARYEAGDYIFRYGERGETFYVILKGRVEITVPPKTDPVKAPNQESHLTTVRQGSVSLRRSSTHSNLTFGKRLMSKLIPQDLVVTLRDESSFIKVTDLGPGGSFGELALQRGGLRNASVKCLERVEVLTINKADYSKVLGAFEEQRQQDKVAFLSQLQCFKKLSKRALNKLSKFFYLKHYKRGTLVYNEGQEADNVYVVVSGEFQVLPTQFSRKAKLLQSEYSLPTTKIDRLYGEMKDRVRGRRHAELSLMIKGSMEMFGDEDVIDRSLRRCTCLCTKSAWVYLIKGSVSVTQHLISEVSDYTIWEGLKDKNSTESKWLETRLNSLESVEDFKVSSFTARSDHDTSPQRIRRIIPFPANRVEPIFKTEIDALAKREYTASPIKVPSEVLPMSLYTKIETKKLTRTSLYSMSARRQASNLYLPKVEVRSLSRRRLPHIL